MTFNDWLDKNWQKDNMFPPPLDAQLAVQFLKDYLLGEDWYVVNPLGIEQINSEIVGAILSKYSKKYRKEVKQLKKQRGIK